MWQIKHWLHCCSCPFPGNVWHHFGWEPARGCMWTSVRVSGGLLAWNSHFPQFSSEPSAGPQPGLHCALTIPHSHLWTTGEWRYGTLFEIFQHMLIRMCWKSLISPSPLVNVAIASFIECTIEMNWRFLEICMKFQKQEMLRMVIEILCLCVRELSLSHFIYRN